MEDQQIKAIFAANLTEAIKESVYAGKNKKELGEAFGVSDAMASNYQNPENEKFPSLQRAINISNILGVCVEWLLTGRGPKHPIQDDSDPMAHILIASFKTLPEEKQRAVFQYVSFITKSTNADLGIDLDQ